MKKETKMLLKRFVVMLAIVSIIFSNIPSTWTNIFAATKSSQTILKQTSYREMLVGDTYDFDITGLQPGSSSVWSSSNKKVATVNRRGLVKAVAVGTATITCTITKNNKQTVIKAKVVVRNASKKPAKSIKINNKITSMKPGETYDLNDTYSPKDASDYTNWSSSDTKVATVDKDGVVTAKAKGTVTIKASALNSTASDKVVIKISSKTTPKPTPTVTLTPTPTVKPTPTVTPSTPSTPSTPTTPPTPTTSPTPTPVVDVNTKVDDKGFTSEGRIVAKFGTPKIDGVVDDIWKNAIRIQPPHTNNAAVKATATFKVLWDDNALYFLAEVQDPNMSVTPSNAYEQDSFEFFLDENNDKTSSYGSDDLHFRVNYNNVQSIDQGSGDRFYTAAKTGDNGYLVEGRIELQKAAKNNTIYGTELQVNDCIGSSRAGTITVFDTTDSAWSKPTVFGEIVLTGKKPGDVPGLNPYKLKKLITSAEKMEVTDVAFTASLDAAKEVYKNDKSTQVDIDTAYDNLNNVITFVNAVTKAAKMDLTVYQSEGADAVKKAVDEAKKLLAVKDVSTDQMNEAIAAIDKAVSELKVKGLDKDGNLVAKFGSPVIDGAIDEVWNKDDFVPATASGSGSTDTTAKFKVLWDDRALYVLADVNDSALDVTSGTVYNRDCIEIFLDEGNNAIENIFDLDDCHYRISCENSLSADRGSLDRLYTKVEKKKDAEGNVTGYVLEARIALQNPAEAKNIYGMELQLNDAKGGNRTGTLNVFDKTSSAYASPTKLGKVVLSERNTGDITGFEQYDLLKMVNIANDIQLERYTDATAATVKNLVAQADATISTGDQDKVDKLCADINQAIKKLVHKAIKDIDPAVAKIKEFRRIPADYLTAAAYDDKAKGTVVRDFYDTYEYGDDGTRGAAVKKDMLVYLPVGYKAEDKTKKYNVLYLIHGTSENQNTVFGDDDVNVTTVMKKVLDEMIANGELDPMIIVCPTYKGMESGRLQYEMINEILPYIATKYNTYAESGSSDALKAARNHQAVGGFSQGSSCTFTIMRNCFAYFKYYIPLSGGPGSADFTSVVKGYSMNDYYVFAATGTDDIAYGGMVNAIPAMADQKDSEGNLIFNYNADLSQGNLYLLLLPGGTHTWQCVNQYLYNILPDLFFAEKETPVIVTDENGYTADGKIVGNYGTPKIDGEIDEAWKNAIQIQPLHTNNAAVKATATFKVLWDDDALYFLAQVKDPNLSVAPSATYQQDSIEVFLDENNDKTTSYGSDDIHFRVNYNNVQSYDQGSGSRFYTATKVGENEYLVEGRIELLNPAKNNTIYGMELQVNDCIGSSRAGTITLFDTTDSAWKDTSLFGEVVLTGKKPGDVPGINPYKLRALVESAKNVDVTGFTKGVGAFTARLDAAKAAIDTATTQTQIDAVYDALSNIMSFMDVIKKYANMNLDAINNGDKVKEAVAAAEDILAKADATPDEITQASNTLNAAIDAIGSYSLKDVYADKFYMGAAVHLNGLADEKYTKNLLSQYNSITAENDMKPEALLDQAASVSAGAIQCNFTKMDQYCDFAVANGLKMRGHTFVWHSQTPAWFFKVGFNADGAYVDKDTMNQRLKEFMYQVFDHIKAKYPDLFYAYDVCNEVVSAMSMESSNNWYQVYKDYSYVTKAFEYAREASAGTGIKLYYNDYNEYDSGKAEKIIALLADAKAAGNIDGIGMQSHVNIEYPPMDQYSATIEKFANAGYDIQITELDIATKIDGNGPAPTTEMAAKQAQIYKELFQIYIKYKDYISSVTLWGINDQHSWRATQEPLIYDRNYKEKDSYWNIISVGLAGK